MAGPRIAYVHVGLPKTGTSYLQSVLSASGPALASQGLTVLPTSATSHQVMLSLREMVRDDLDDTAAHGAFASFATEAAALPKGNLLLSQELLGLATADQVRRLVAALPAYEVHLVITLRDLTSLLPSLWQQLVKARSTRTFGEFLDEVVGADLPVLRGYNVLGTLTAWRDVVPAERTHVVLVPPRGAAPSLLLDRFCGVLGIDPATLDDARPRQNPSLGLVQAELLRRVNLALGDDLPHPRAGYRGPGKRFLAEQVLVAQDGRPTQLPEAMRPWVEQRTALVTQTLRDGGYDVVGELSDLGPDPAGFDPAYVDPSAEEVLDAAAASLAAVLVDRAERGSELKRLRRRVRQLEREPKPGLLDAVRRRLSGPNS